MSAQDKIECRVRLKNADFIMQNHRVHGVSILPGVTFLDIVYRILTAQKLDHRRAILRNILFPEPVVTRDGFDRDLLVTMVQTADGTWQVKSESRWVEGDLPRSAWKENFHCELSFVDDPGPGPIDIPALKSGARKQRDMEELYNWARSEGIKHGPPMKCHGPLYIGDSYLLGELHLDASSVAGDHAFYLHPAELDASAIAAFARTQPTEHVPYIPVFIDRFRAHKTLPEKFYLYSPHMEEQVASGDLIHSDYFLYDAEGQFIAEFAHLTCKRIRLPELITRLVEEVGNIPIASGILDTKVPNSAAAPPKSFPQSTSRFSDYLCTTIARRLDRPAGEIKTNVPFYELGMDSLAMLRISQELEKVVASSLYPTLLFEHGNIDALAAHLESKYEFHENAIQAESVTPAASDLAPFEATCYRTEWFPIEPSQSSTGSNELGDVVILGAENDLQQSLCKRLAAPGRRIIRVGSALKFTKIQPDVYELDFTNREQIRSLLEALAASGTVARQYVLIAERTKENSPRPSDAVHSCLSLWALAAELSVRKQEHGSNLRFIYRREHGHSPAHYAAVGALARAVSDEAQVVHARAVELEEEASADSAAEIVCQELHDRTGEFEVHYRRGRRHVRRYAPYLLEDYGKHAVLKNRGVYVLAGVGGISRIVAERLAKDWKARLVLIGRRPLTDTLSEDIKAWRTGGAEVKYIQADITNQAEVTATLAAAREAFGRIDGIFHCAGVLADALFFRKDTKGIQSVLAPKVMGATYLDTASKNDKLDFFVMFSSLSASMTNIGQCDYAFANAYLEQLAEWRADRSDRSGKTLAIGWPFWAEGGMQVPPDVQERSRQQTGIVPLPTSTALDILFRALSGTEARFAVVYGEPEKTRSIFPQESVFTAAEEESSSFAAEPVDAIKKDSGHSSDIAIIGLAGQYPQAPDLEQFWQNLVSGRDCIVEVPTDRWDHSLYFDPEKGRTGKTYGKWGGFLDGVDLFDPALFGISRKEAERMDPQERLFLKTSWMTLHNAGYTPQSLSDETIGVFAGVMWNHYQLLEDRESGAAPTAMHASVPNRVSYCFNFRGPSMAVDTGCSASLTALHLAIESIHRGECTLALAGGVNVSIHPQKYLQLAQGRFLSSDGRCRSFGKDGNGYVPGEGVGAVLLKPLSRALADGDHIYGVIKGSYVNHTGRTSGFTVPSPDSQANLIREAMTRSGVDPETISYIEAHGTGTSLGDPIEMDGLQRAFAGTSLPLQSCAVGSVKSNIGHLESAAGIAGLTKVLLQMKHRLLSPSLHSEETNPHIDFKKSIFFIPRQPLPWRPQANGTTLRAGISAFGAGGTNVHVLLENYAPEASPRNFEGPFLFILSAKDRTALQTYARSLVSFLAGDVLSASSNASNNGEDLLRHAVADVLGVPTEAVNPRESFRDLGFDTVRLAELAQRIGSHDSNGKPSAALALDATIENAASHADTMSANSIPSLDDLCYTLQVGRTSMSARLAIVTRDVDGLRSGLNHFLGGDQPGPDEFWNLPPAGEAEVVAEKFVELFHAGNLRGLARDWVSGANVPWPRCYPRPGWEQAPHRVPLPMPPFNDERCWLGRWKSQNQSDVPTVKKTQVEAAAPAALPQNLRATEDLHSGLRPGMSLLEGGVALIVMKDESNANMFTERVLHDVETAFAEIAQRPEIKAVVITGTGNVFSMGADRQSLEKLVARETRFTDSPFLYEGLLRCDRPVIAAIQGHASGGGMIFGLYADIVLMAREGVYAANFLKYGFTPGLGATYILEKRFGQSLAAEMFYTGRSFTGEELERRGAQVTVLPQNEILNRALEMARSIAEKPPNASQTLKRELANRTLDKLPEIVASEDGMHDRVMNEGTVQRIRDHFGKVESFHQPAPARTPQEKAIPTPAPDPVLVPVSAPEPEEAYQQAEKESVASTDYNTVVAAIEKALCAHLYLDRIEIDPQLTFNEMGVDSIGAVEIIRDLNRSFNLNLESPTIYDHPTVPRLAKFVLSQCARTQTPVVQLAAPAEESKKTAQPLAKNSSASVRPASTYAVKLDPPSKPAASSSTPPTSAKSAYEIRLDPASKPAASSSAPWNITPPASSAKHMVELAPTKPAGTASASNSVTSTPTRSLRKIAVIGMSGRFPDALDLDAFWANLCAGRSGIHEVPADRWNYNQNPNQKKNGGTASPQWAGLLDEVDCFDAAFFNLSPMEAELMDPQQRIFLEHAWSALENAGYAGTTENAQQCGVFVGCAAGDYLRLVEQAGAASAGLVFLGHSASILAARIAYFLNLNGPTLAVETACSSSLVAVHLACESIRNGECSMALAGGVALMSTPMVHNWIRDLSLLSPRGRISPFDKSADGLVLGEGIGVVALKALDKALEDGDHIYGVIAASGVNSDGKTNGIMAPSALSQLALFNSVYARAGITPADVNFVETHGAGTLLGDPIEFKALNDFFRRYTTQVGYCALGSVKSNIGHTTLAAGVAGLLKVLLALRNSYLPPSLNFENANPHIAFEGSPFFVETQGTDWRPGKSGRRIAGVSSFGFSGTNCHVVVEEAPPLPAQDHDRRNENDYFLIPVSAKTEEALKNRLQQLADHLKYVPKLPDLAFTLGAGRQHFRFRVAFVVRNLQDLAQSLQLFQAGQKTSRVFQQSPGIQAPVPPRSQNDTDIWSSEYLEQLAKAYVQGAGPDFATIYKGYPARRIPLPTYPFARVRHWIKGDSLPEASTIRHHLLLGRLSPDIGSDKTAIFSCEIRPDDRIVADHRVTATSILPATACLEMALSGAAAANISTPLRLTSVRWIQRLEVVAPRSIRFSITPEGSRHIFELRVPEEHVPYARGTISSAVERRSPETVDLAAFARQCPNTVSRQEIYAAFDKAGIQYGPSFRVLESVAFGKDQALGKLVSPEMPVGDPSQFKLHPCLLDAALQAAAVLESQVGDQPYIPVSLNSLELLHTPVAPAYSCVTRKGDHKFDVVITDLEGRVCVLCEGFALRARKIEREANVLIPTWMEAEKLPRSTTQNSARRRVGVFYTPGTNPSLVQELTKLHLDDEIVEAQSGASLRSPLDMLYFIASSDGLSRLEQSDRTLALFHIVKTLISIDQAHHPLQLKVVLTGGVATAKEEPLRPDLAGMLGLSRAIDAEYPRWKVGCIDIGTDRQDPATTARRIFDETLDHRLIALRGDRRLFRVFKPCPSANPSTSLYKQRGAYLILGGTGGIGLALSRHLARTKHARLAWIGRRPLDSELEHKLDEIKSLGGEAIYIQADATNLFALEHAVATVRREFGAINGAIHTAGVLLGKTLANLTEAEFLKVLDPKVVGAVNLVETLKKETLDFLIFFSSAASFVPPGGQANYAAASTFEDAYAYYVRQQYHLPASVINWGYWGDVGMVAQESYAARFAAMEVKSIGAEEGMTALEKILVLNLPQALVMKGNPSRFSEFGIHVVDGDAETSPSSSPVELPLHNHAVMGYIKDIFAEILKCQPSTLGEQETFENFGVDSLVGMRILDRLEEDLGDLPSTLLFECLTLEQLAGYLSQQRGAQLAALLKPKSQPKSKDEYTQVPAQTPEHQAQVKAPALPALDRRTSSTPSVEVPLHDHAVMVYIKSIFAEVLKCQPSILGEKETFENFGVDSLVGMRILDRLEEDLGDLPSTLLFECLTLEQLAEYLSQQRGARLAPLLKPQPKSTSKDEYTRVQAQAPDEHQAEVKPPTSSTQQGFNGKPHYSSDDIAVIGMSGRYPQSPDIATFWKNLASGANCITEIPESRWDWRSHFDPRRGQPNRSYGKWAGFLENIDRFDAAFFNILPRDAAHIDPQERLFLETCWNLLEETGYLGEHTREPETGVFVGVMYGSYGKLGAMMDWPRGHMATAHSDYWSMANRVSYFFDLRGPSYAVDSACSSSLTAVHLACEAMRRGECRMAIAGGVNLIIHQAHFVALSAMNMLSTHPGCWVFDESADGYVPGEGVGALLLKPLHRAVEDGDEIWGIIKSSAVNSGGKTGGYTVPNPAAQTQVIAEALRRSGVHPDTVTYVEAHGTGTELGDPIEVASLGKAFASASQMQSHPHRAIGSVKSNIGHLEGAAGIAGLTKVLLQLKHKQIAPSLNVKKLNPKIDFTSSPFRVQTALANWEQPVLNLDGREKSYPRRAGVSSFGAGGANAHVIVEEYCNETVSTEDPGDEQIFVLSAKTSGQLKALVRSVAEFLSSSENQPFTLRELAYTSQLGRKEMAERIAFCAHTIAELAGLLKSFLDHGNDDRIFTTPSGVKMPDEHSGQRSNSRKTQLPELARAWVSGSKVDWRQLWLAQKPRRVAFPTYPFEKKRFWLSAGDASTGPIVDTTESVRVTAEPEREWKSHRAERILPNDAFYCTDHRVSGERWLPGVAFLDMICQECGDRAGKTFQISDLKWLSPLKLADGENCIEIALESREGKIDFRVTAVAEPARVLVRGTASWPNPEKTTSLDLAALREQCPKKGDAALFYVDLARGGLDYGPAFRTVNALWIGDNQCMAHLSLPQSLERDLQSFRLHPALMDGALQAMACLSKGSTSYLPVAFSQMTIHAPLTSSCWAHIEEVKTREGRDGSRYFNLSVANESGNVLAHVNGLQVFPHTPKTISCRYLRPIWEMAESRRESRSLKTVLLVTDDEQLRDSLQNVLVSQRTRCISVVPGSAFAQLDELTYQLAPGDREHYQRLIEHLTARDMMPDGVIHFWSHNLFEANADGLPAQLDRGFYSVLWLVTAIFIQAKETQLRFVFAHSEHSSDPQPQFAAVAGALKTLAMEHSGFAAARVVLESHESALSSMAERLFDELLSCSNEVAEISYRSSGRWVKRLELFDPSLPSAPPRLSLRPGGTYLITGGAGVLGLRFAEFLARQGATHIVLVGRSTLDRERQARLNSVAFSKQLHYHQADLSQESELQELVASIRKQYGPIHGLIHAAGVNRDARAIKKTRAEAENVIAPKVMGTLYLDEATRFEPLDFFVLFSSIAGETGNLGQVDYAFGNAFMNQFVAIRELRRNAGLRSGKTLAICWPLWKESGMNVDSATLRLLLQRWKMVPLSTEAGLRAFCHGLSRPESCFAVVQNPEPAAVPTKSENRTMKSTPSQTTEERSKIESDLRLLASRFLLVDPKEVDLQANLMELGFDSISLTELTNEVNEKYGLSMLPTVLFERPNLVGLAATLQNALGATIVEHPPAAEPEPAEIVEAPLPEPVLAKEQQNGRKAQRQEVAIIGMAGMLPKSEDLEEFWRHLVAGKDLVDVVPENRTELRLDPVTSKIRGGFLGHVGHFDAQFFGISPREASLMDPQQRIFLETVWYAIQDAGYRTSDLAGTSTGLFAGVSTFDYGDILKASGIEIEAHTATGIAHSILPNRISYLFDLHGPSESVDTACSSSLVALHRAVRAIADGECEMAIAGGVNVTLNPGLYKAFFKSGMLSPDGKCKTFDQSADGYVRGEGSGAVFLKPLDRALADGDHVYAVIKGSAINHVGRSTSLTAPNPESQAAVIVQAFRTAGIHPGSVTYMEAHGTGTNLGDPIEIEGLKKAFTTLHGDSNELLPSEPRIAIGATKTHIGHLEAAAGIAGVLKVLLCMQHRALPGNLHFQTLNPHIRLEQTPFYINQEMQPWEPVFDGGKAVRRAGVSSFGFGGSNAHVVLEAFNSSEPANRGKRPNEYLIVLSAPSGEALAVYAERIARVLQQRPTTDLANIAYTLQVGRAEMTERLAIVARDRNRLTGALLAAARGDYRIPGMYRGTAKASQENLGASENLEALAEAWVRGAAIDWQLLHDGFALRRISLPTFPLARTRHWFNESSSTKKINVPPQEQIPLTKNLEPKSRGRYAPKIILSTPKKASEEAPSQKPLSSRQNGQAGLNVAEPKVSAPSLAVPVTGNGSATTTSSVATMTAPGVENGSASRTAAPIAEIVKQILVSLLDIPATEIQEDRRFADLGLDSIYRIELVRQLNRILAVDLKARELYNFETFGQLVQGLQEMVPQSPQHALHAQHALQAQPVVKMQPVLEIPAAARKSNAQEQLLQTLHTMAAKPSQSIPQPQPMLQPKPEGLGASRAQEAADQVLSRLISQVIRRSFDPKVTFAENAFTSFDMLRVIALLEKQLGALRKTLLFDYPTLATLTAHLSEVHGIRAVEKLTSAQVEGSENLILLTSPDVTSPDLDNQPIVLAKSRLHEHSSLASLVIELEQRYGKESGLPSRDIAPFVFIGAERHGYFHISVREETLFAWSYVGSPDYFSQLAHELVVYADAHRLTPSLLSMARLTEVSGRPFTATPFGAVQRIWNLPEFTLEGHKMRHIRYMVRKFERSGACRAVEYQCGSDPALDKKLVDLIDRWCQVKPMVNPYVARVKREILEGTMTSKHRIFLTYLDDALVAAIVITRILSENGYGLDLEFYSADTPLGAIDWTVVQIIEKIVSEGFTLFSLGGTWGVKITDSPNADPDVEQALDQMRSTGIFNGDSNLQFKNKFRPENAPIYLCRPAGTDPSDIVQIILMIAEPSVAAAHSNGTAVPDKNKPSVPIEPRSSAQEGTERERIIAASGYNPVKIPHHQVEFDLITDSWTELDAPVIHERMAALAASLVSNGAGSELSTPSWLPFSHVTPAMSGRSAEAALCSSWPKRNQVVVQHSLFPTWALSQLESGFMPVVVKPAGEPSPDRLFQADISIADLKRLLSENAGQVAHIALELSTNATGGYPISLANLKQVKEAAKTFGVPLVLDATRIVENAYFIAEHEQEHSGRSVWDITREILALADTATLSLSKDFGINFGGLLATNDSRLIHRLRERANTRGTEVGLSNRRLISAALADQAQVENLVKARMAAVKTLWERLSSAEVPVMGPASGHCVLLDVNRMAQFKGFRFPIQACLLWIYQNTGIRAAAHLAGKDSGAAFQSSIRLAVPVGLSQSSVEQIAAQLVELFRNPGKITDLVRVDDPSGHTSPVLGDYHPSDSLPEDIRVALEERAQPRNDNVAVLQESSPAVERHMVTLPEGEVEVFMTGAGPTLLLIHPFNIGAGFFAPQFKALDNYFRMVAVHSPGVGSTRMAAADFSFTGLARFSMRVLRELGISMPVHVLGASFGGVTAQAFALEYPNETASMTLLGSSYKVGNRPNVSRLGVVARADIDGVLKNAPSERLQQQRDQIVELLLRCESMDPRTGLNYLEEFTKQPDFLTKLPLIAAPTLIVHGRFDSAITLKTAHLIHGAIPNARYEEIADAGHFPSLTSSDQVNRILVEFLTEVSSEQLSAGDQQALAAASTGGIRL